MNDTSDKRTTDDAVDVVDWWASRVVDREVEFADVPADLRAQVQSRAADFAAVRTGLSVIGAPGVIDDIAIARAIKSAKTAPRSSWRRIGGPLSMAAALIGVIAIGITAIGRDSRSSDDLATADQPMMSSPLAKTIDTEAPASESQEVIEAAGAAESEVMSSTGESVVIADMVELGRLTNGWWTTPPTMSPAAMCPLAEGMQRVDMSVTFAGIPAEIHLGPSNLKVVALSDCMVLAGITP